MLRLFLATDVERVESNDVVSPVSEEVFLGHRIFYGLVFPESSAVSFLTSRLDIFVFIILVKWNE